MTWVTVPKMFFFIVLAPLGKVRVRSLCGPYTASAPEMISISSLVMTAWRVRL
jgi:hypothetical protein